MFSSLPNQNPFTAKNVSFNAMPMTMPMVMQPLQLQHQISASAASAAASAGADAGAGAANSSSRVEMFSFLRLHREERRENCKSRKALRMGNFSAARVHELAAASLHEQKLQLWENRASSSSSRPHNSTSSFNNNSLASASAISQTKRDPFNAVPLNGNFSSNVGAHHELNILNGGGRNTSDSATPDSSEEGRARIFQHATANMWPQMPLVRQLTVHSNDAQQFYSQSNGINSNPIGQQKSGGFNEIGSFPEIPSPTLLLSGSEVSPNSMESSPKSDEVTLTNQFGDYRADKFDFDSDDSEEEEMTGRSNKSSKRKINSANNYQFQPNYNNGNNGIYHHGMKNSGNNVNHHHQNNHQQHHNSNNGAAVANPPVYVNSRKLKSSKSKANYFQSDNHINSGGNSNQQNHHQQHQQPQQNNLTPATQNKIDHTLNQVNHHHNINRNQQLINLNSNLNGNLNANSMNNPFQSTFNNTNNNVLGAGFSFKNPLGNNSIPIAIPIPMNTRAPNNQINLHSSYQLFPAVSSN